MNADTKTQLRLVEEVGGALDAARIDWWLYGGWAMDFHAGRVTRDHADIELFVWQADVERVGDALTRAGFIAIRGGAYPDEAQPFVKEGQEIGAWFLIRDPDSRVVTPGRWSDWPWPPGAFDNPRARIDDVVAPVMSVAGLLDMKENFPKHRHGRPLRPKDEADIALLRELLASQPRG